MRKLLFLLVFVVGCGSAGDAEKPNPVVSDADQNLVIRELGRNQGIWRLVELNYEGRKHVFLQNYDGSNQGIVKVGEYSLTPEPVEIPPERREADWN